MTRTLTATENGRWSFSAEVPGFTVTASPATLNLKKGKSATVKVTFTRDGAEANTWQHGSLTWSGGKRRSPDVTSPVTLRAVDVAAESAIEGTGAEGSAEVTLTGGITGTVAPTVLGLGKAAEEVFAKVPGPLKGGTDASNQLSLTAVEPGTTTVSWHLQSGDEAADWDMFVITPDNRTLQVATASASEQLTLSDPAPGNYYVVSNLYSSPDGAASPATLSTVKTKGDAGNLSLSEDQVALTQGEDTTVTASWGGLTEGTWHGLITWVPGTATAVSVTVGQDGKRKADCQERPVWMFFEHGFTDFNLFLPHRIFHDFAGNDESDGHCNHWEILVSLPL